MLANGSYRVAVDSFSSGQSGWHDSAFGCEESTPVVVAGPTHTALRISAPPVANGHTVSGSVTIDGTPVTEGSVSLYATCDDFRDGDPTTYNWFENGQFSVWVPSGTYLARITGPAQDRSYWHDTQRRCADATPIEVVGDTIVNLTGADSRTRQTVSGKVTGVQPIGGLFELVSPPRVNFYDSCADAAAGEAAVGHSKIAQDFPAFSTDWEYTANIPDGTYRARFTGMVEESWNGAAWSCAASTPVTVSGDTTADLAAATAMRPSPAQSAERPQPLGTASRSTTRPAALDLSPL